MKKRKQLLIVHGGYLGNDTLNDDIEFEEAPLLPTDVGLFDRDIDEDEGGNSDDRTTQRKYVDEDGEEHLLPPGVGQNIHT